MKNTNRNGFSLIELLIAMAIMAGLATMALPNFDLASDNVKKTEMQNDARNTIALIDSYHVIEMELPDRQTLNNGSFLGNHEVKINEESVIYYELNNDCINGYEITLERTNVDKNVYYNFCYGKVEVVDKPPRLALRVVKSESAGMFDIEELSKNDYEAVLAALNKYRKYSINTENMDDDDWEDYLENELLANETLSFSFGTDNNGKDYVQTSFPQQWYSLPNSQRNVYVSGDRKYISSGIDYLNE